VATGNYLQLAPSPAIAFADIWLTDFNSKGVTPALSSSYPQ